MIIDPKLYVTLSRYNQKGEQYAIQRVVSPLEDQEFVVPLIVKKMLYELNRLENKIE